MDERVSYFDDFFFIRFMKVDLNSCSRLCSKHQQKLFCRLFSSCNSHNKYKHWWDSFCMTQHVVVSLFMDMESAKSYVNRWRKKKCFLLLCIRKWRKKTKKYFKNLSTQFILDQTRVSKFLQTVQIRIIQIWNQSPLC